MKKEMWPNVLILDEVSYAVIGQKYVFDDCRVRIRGLSYPIYKRSEIGTHQNEIEKLALFFPDRTIETQVISKEEMGKIKGRKYD